MTVTERAPLIFESGAFIGFESTAFINGSESRTPEGAASCATFDGEHGVM